MGMAHVAILGVQTNALCLCLPKNQSNLPKISLEYFVLCSFTIGFPNLVANYYVVIALSTCWSIDFLLLHLICPNYLGLI